MNKEIAVIMRDKLAGLPFLDIVGGLVQTLTKSDPGEAGSMIQKKFPVSSDTNVPQGCRKTPEKLLIPDSSRKSVIYFEDFGMAPGQSRGRFQTYNSTIRLVCWYNKKLLFENPAVQATASMIAQIKAKLETRNPENTTLFLRMKRNLVRTPINDAAIFSRYSYTEEDRQYLRPPFDFFAMDFNVNFELNPKCANPLIYKSPPGGCYSDPPKSI